MAGESMMSRKQLAWELVVAFVAVMTGVGAAQGAPVIKYDYSAGNYLPSHPSQGSWSQLAVNGSTTTATNNTTDSALLLGDTDSIIGPWFNKAITPADYSGDWVVTAVARIDSANSIAGWVLDASINTFAWNIWLDGSGTNQVYTFDDSGAHGPTGIYSLAVVPNMSTEFHTYQLVGNGLSAPELWVDGVATGAFAGRQTLGSPGNSVSFGAFWSGSTQGTSNWQVVRFDSDLSQLPIPVPEPSTFVLVALGALALVRRRR
jgi:hypothetical protein